MNQNTLVQQLRDSGSHALAAIWSVAPERLNEAGYEQGWTIRQLMAHLASMEFAYRRLPDLARGSGDAQALPDGRSFDMDGYNARQVGRRAQSALADLADEFARGRGAVVAAVAGLDGGLLQRPVRSAGGVTGSLADVIHQTAVEHVTAHSADLMRAAAAVPSPAVRAAATLVIAGAEAAAMLDGLTIDRWRHHAAGADWSAAGISGHLVELLPYWASEIERVSSQPDAVLGRDINAPERLGAVVNGEAMSPAEGAEAIRGAAQAAATIIRRLPADTWAHPVQRLRYGASTIGACIDQLLVQHVCEHLTQLVAAIGPPAAA